MTNLPTLLLEMAASLPPDQGGGDEGVAVSIETVGLRLPIEVRFDGHGRLGASLPRNRMATGFDTPVSILAATFVRSGT